MKRKLLTLALAVLTVGLLGSCSKINERIDNLEQKIGNIENKSIASVHQQIDGINVSLIELAAADAAINGKLSELKATAEAQQTLIDALKKADEALGQKDDALEARIAALEGQAATVTARIETLVEADKAINARIDELKSYVDTELGKVGDWATATFATLDQYRQTADALAALSVTVAGISTTLEQVQASIAGLDTKIDGIDTALQEKIATAKTELEGRIDDLQTELEGEIAEKIGKSETSIKAWINEMLEGYYTIAQVDAKVTALNTAIDAVREADKERTDSVAAELTALKTAVDTVKAAIRTEYRSAIATAIHDYDGEIRGALKDSIDKVNGRIEALDTRVAALESAIADITGRVVALEKMIQSVTIVPAYADGSVEAADGILTIDFVVSPAEAVIGVTKDSIKVLVHEAKVQTKAASYTTINVMTADVEKNEKGEFTGNIKITADISGITLAEGNSLTVALNVRNGISDFTTKFVKVVNTVVPNKVSKVADYLYEYTAEGYSTEAPSELLLDDGPVPIFGCSAVRNGDFYGRNLDFNINEICEFVVRTKATETRPHASIGVANTCFLNITNDMVKAGLSDNLLKYIPWMMMDGINDAGLVCNINVVNAADIKEHPHTHTNEGAPQIMVMQLIRALLDNCGSVAQAKTYIESHDIREIPTTWDGHIMIADPNETVIVEFTGETGNEVKYAVQEQMIMTNFYNHLFKENNFLRDGSINNFPAHACGMERYMILSKNYATGNSMQGMWELLKKVRYTQTYDTSVEPFWCSEYYDTPKIPTFDEHPMSYWTKDRVLAQEKPAAEVAAYAEYAKTGKYNEEDGLWFTTHNSTYDIVNKALWVTIREKYESIYKFELK